MKTILTKLCFDALILFGAVSIVTAADSSPVPKEFSAYIGGFMGPSYQIELHGSALTYTTFDSGHRNPRRTTITPTAAQWRVFRQALDDLKVWQWRGDYPNTGTLDGTQWSLDLAFADQALKTHGDNSYPDASGKPNGKPEPTKAFTRYLAAIQKLLGSKTFQ